MCPVCRGRGTVEAGVHTGVREYGPVLMGKDWKGRDVPTRSSFPTGIRPNPNALVTVRTGRVETDYLDVWIWDENPLCELWGIAICGKCRGTGFVK